jgi:hypothetical protein
MMFTSQRLDRMALLSMGSDSSSRKGSSSRVIPSLSEFLFLVRSLAVLGCLLAKLAISDRQKRMSLVVQMAPLMICLAIRFINDAINLDGRDGALNERSSNRRNLVLVSVSILNTDLSS